MKEILSHRFKGILPLGFAMIITMMIVTSLVAASQIKLSTNSMLSSIHNTLKTINNKQ